MLQRTPDHAMLSLHPTHLDAIISGRKWIELRRRTPTLSEGSQIWLYGTVPCGMVMAVAHLKQIVEGAPEYLWSEYEPGLALDKREFDAYLAGSKKAAALQLSDIRTLTLPIQLTNLKSLEPGFHPPQFFRFLRPGPILEALEAALF